MGFSIAQGGNTLYTVLNDGTVAALTLPTGVTVDSAKRLRAAIISRFVVLGGSPLVNLVFDPNVNALRVFVPIPPASPALVAVGATTGLTGAYRIRVSFAIKDENGAIVAESPLGPISDSVTLANQSLGASALPISAQSDVNCRRLYRTTAGGSVYFPWVDIDGNTTTTYDGNESDASLQLEPGDPTLGAPPGTTPDDAFKVLVSWKGRLWAVSTRFDRRDYVVASELDLPWAWDLSLAAAPIGGDEYGVTGFLPRRDELVIGRRNRILRIVESAGADDAFEVFIIAENVGVISADSCVVIRDVGYFLHEDGVYTIGPNGVSSISREQVHAWFTTDTYFNRSEFDNAVGCWDPGLDCYRLFLASPNQTTLDRYVDYYLSGPYAGKWLGPHKTDAFTPTFAGLTLSSAATPVMLVGASNGYLHSVNHATRTDGQSTAIDFDVEGKFHSADTPDVTKSFLQATVISKIESGGTLQVIPKVGGLDASAGSTISVPLTAGRTRTRRLGTGRLCQIRLRENTVNQDVTVYGYEIPFVDRGRR